MTARALAAAEEVVLEPLANLDDEISWVIDRFERHFARAGYRREPAVRLTSGVDPSVVFVGSTANVFKRYLLAPGGLPEPRFVVQPALRTQYLRTIADPDSRPAKTSLFTAVGIVAPPRAVEPASRDCYAFMSGLFADRARPLVLRVATPDSDLVELVDGLEAAEVELDGCPPRAYRHYYGVEGLVGRNFNFAAVGAAGELCDIGNFVVLERGGRVVGAEFGIGAGTTLQWLHRLAHPLLASPVGRALPLRDFRDVKLADCIAAAHALLVEGLRPNATSPGKVLRAYLRAISALRRPGEDGLDEVASAVAHLCRSGTPSHAELADAVREYVRRHEELTAAGVAPARLAAALGEVF